MPSLFYTHTQRSGKTQACDHYSAYLQGRGDAKRVFDEGHFQAALSQCVK